ncbi:gag/pol protein [Cucumis melo var. makuwa]|uniref:Gag/pol protein n=1 Tax=Cucumis melo var. makuwa TaxID=1194695 RepID=A0A5D3DUS8_CUCMM|nr:gag/pol protein [Cucumis melo var. makuwa]TYK27129.1 gag/pol protein [Cucumis melo var. makuwa]
MLSRYKMKNSKKVGNLMYAMLCTRPDICYSVRIVSRYQSNPGHVKKSRSGSVFTLNGGAVVWRSIKQSCIADSTMKAEYVAACEAAKKAVWLKKFLTDLEVVLNMHLPITLYFDNSGAVATSREPRSHKREKHIERKYYLIKEIVHRGDVTVTKTPPSKAWLIRLQKLSRLKCLRATYMV